MEKTLKKTLMDLLKERADLDKEIQSQLGHEYPYLDRLVMLELDKRVLMHLVLDLYNKTGSEVPDMSYKF